jgi:hypothetical protein
MNVPSVRFLGIVAGAIVALPLVLVVVLPPLVTFLGWLVRVPVAFLSEIMPGGDSAVASRRRGG